MKTGTNRKKVVGNLHMLTANVELGRPTIRHVVRLLYYQANEPEPNRL